MSQQSRPEDIEYRLRLKWGSVFQYTTREHSCDDVLAENYFHNISTRYFQAGDEIHIAVLDEASGWMKGVFEVAFMDLKNTIIQQVEAWRFGEIAKPKEPGKAIPKKKPLEKAA
jgi:hypothetical protein|tara:strand:- start:231 stop:572 length:342 start_codon:yes stop_codon:yes gene_type:complete